MAEDIIVRYRAEVDEATRKLELFAKANEELATDTKSAAKAIDNTTKSVDKLEKEVSDTGTKVKSASKEIKNLESAGTQSFNRLGSSVKSFGVAAAGALAAAFSIGLIKDFARAAIDAFSKLETARIVFTSLVGDATKAKILFDDLENFSIKTPFTPTEIQDAAKALLQFGVATDDILGTVKTLGDVSAGTGKNISELAIIFGQIKSTGRLLGQDLLQLINAGFNPLQEISERTGKSVADLKKEMEKGNITFEQVAESFKAATSEGGKFFNLTEKLATTTAGQLSTLEGQSEKLAQSIGEKLAPAFIKTKVFLQEFVEAGIDGFRQLYNFVISGTDILELELKQKQFQLNVSNRIAATTAEVTAVFESLKKNGIAEQEAQTKAIDIVRKRLETEKARLAGVGTAAASNEIAVLKAELRALEDINQGITDRIAKEQSLAGLNTQSEADRLKAIKELIQYQKQLRDLQIGNIDDEEFKIRANFADTITELKASGKLRNDIIIELVKKLNSDLLALNEKRFDDEQKIQAKSDAAFFKSLDERTQRTKKQQEESIKLQQDAQQIIFDSFIEEESKQPYLDRLKTFNTLEFELTQELKQKTKDLQKEFDLGEIATLDDLNNKKVILNKEYADKIKAIFNGLGLDVTKNNLELFDTLKQYSDILSDLTSVYNQYANNQIAQLERQREASNQFYEEQRNLIDEDLAKRRISTAEAAVLNERLNQKKIKSDEEAAKKERDLKRKQFIINKTAAIIEITISTAKAVAANLAVPALAALYAALGAAQAALVASQPVPYAKGTKSAKGGLSRVGEQGEEIMYVPQGTKVLPNGKTNKYGEVLDSMFDNRFETYVLNRYVNPALQKQKKDYEGRKSESFAHNIAKSVSVSKDVQGLTDYGMYKLWKQGQTINNTKQLAKDIASELNIDIYRR